MSLGLVSSLAFCGGGIFGHNLALKGINSDNALKNYQKPLVWLIFAIAPLIAILIILDKYHLASLLPKIFPSTLLIYLAGYFNELIVGFGCFFLGLLLLLELSGKRSRQKIIELLAAMGAITFALSILLYFLQPVSALVTQPKIVDGVVFQTTPYTCAPSSIATLARYTNKHPNLSEKQAVGLTKTNRFGTTTLAEIKALKKLDLNPEYHHNLTPEDLIAFRKPGLLHVKEKRKKGKGARFSHAVAFFVADADEKIMLIGNPLYGVQIKTFEELKEYWFGEAILIN